MMRYQFVILEIFRILELYVYIICNFCLLTLKGKSIYISSSLQVSVVESPNKIDESYYLTPVNSDLDANVANATENADVEDAAMMTVESMTPRLQTTLPSVQRSCSLKVVDASHARQKDDNLLSQIYEVFRSSKATGKKSKVFDVGVGGVRRCISDAGLVRQKLGKPTQTCIDHGMVSIGVSLLFVL